MLSCPDVKKRGAFRGRLFALMITSLDESVPMMDDTRGDDDSGVTNVGQ